MSQRILEGSLVQTHTFVTAGGLSLVQSSAWDQLGRLVFFFYLDTFCFTDVCHTASGTTCLCIVIKTNKKKKRLPPERKDEQGHSKFGPMVLNSAELNQKKSKICWKEIMTKLVPRIPVSAFFCVRECRTKMYSGFFE